MPENFSSLPIQAPSYSLIKIPEFDTNIIFFGNKTEQRISKWANPRYTFRLRWRSLLWADKKLIMDFYIARAGAYEAFYWRNNEEVANAPQWEAGTAYALNDIIVPTTSNGHSYKCTVAGYSGGTEPASWTTTVNDTESDGAVTWTENTYLVRFDADMLNIELFEYNLYNLNQITFVEVAS